mmetsp:Transcript_17338/g.28832  ORF Transcript_17338/g.28832 Transcript_17338/m.28832 type:complete len:107 (+) Transcript_17338:452-772(+)
MVVVVAVVGPFVSLAIAVIIAHSFAFRLSYVVVAGAPVIIARIACRTATSAIFCAAIVMREAGGYHQEVRANDDGCLHVGDGWTCGSCRDSLEVAMLEKDRADQYQ